MKKLGLLGFAILFACNQTTYAYQFSTYQPLAPLQPIQTIETLKKAKPLNPNNVNKFTQDSNITYPKIDVIEKALFANYYPNENIYERLSRIEKKMFKQTFQNVDLAQRVDNITNSIDPGILYNIPNNQLAQMESKLFNRTFQNDDTETRIIRLEKEMLGAMQSGDLKERYDTVVNATKHYNAFPTEYSSNYNNFKTSNLYPKTIGFNSNNKRGIFSNILSTLGGGVMTGFTPPIYNYYQQQSPYNYPYSNNGNYFGQYNWPTNGAGLSNYYYGNRGYSFQNRDMGRGSTVTILN